MRCCFVQYGFGRAEVSERRASRERVVKVGRCMMDLVMGSDYGTAGRKSYLEIKDRDNEELH